MRNRTNIYKYIAFSVYSVCAAPLGIIDARFSFISAIKSGLLPWPTPCPLRTPSGVLLPEASGDLVSSPLETSSLPGNEVLRPAKPSDTELGDSDFLVENGDIPGDNPVVTLPVTLLEACLAKISEILCMVGDKDALPVPVVIPLLSGDGFVDT